MHGAGDVEIDLVAPPGDEVGQDVHLTPTEYELLRVLAQEAGG